MLLGFAADLLQEFVQELIASRLRIDNEQRREVGIDVPAQCKFHHDPTGDRNAGHADAARIEIAIDVIQHQHDNFVGERKIGHRRMNI